MRMALSFSHRTQEKSDHIENGENVSPEELENELGKSPLVQEVLVREKDSVIGGRGFSGSGLRKKEAYQRNNSKTSGSNR